MNKEFKISFLSILIFFTLGTLWIFFDPSYGHHITKFVVGISNNFIFNIENISSGHYPPFFYIINRIGSWFFGQSEELARMISLLFIIPFVWGIYTIGRNLHSKKSGMYASLIFLITPVIFFIATGVIPDFFSAAFACAAIAAFQNSSSFHSTKYSLLTGIFISISLMSKFSSAPFIIIMMILVASLKKDNLSSFKKNWKNTLLIIFIVILLTSVWYVPNLTGTLEKYTEDTNFTPYNDWSLWDRYVYHLIGFNIKDNQGPLVFWMSLLSILILFLTKKYYTSLFILSWIFIPLFLIFTIIKDVDYNLFLHSFAAICISTGILLTRLRKNWRIIICSIFIFNLLFTLWTPGQKEIGIEFVYQDEDTIISFVIIDPLPSQHDYFPTGNMEDKKRDNALASIIHSTWTEKNIPKVALLDTHLFFPNTFVDTLSYQKMHGIEIITLSLSDEDYIKENSIENIISETYLNISCADYFVRKEYLNGIKRGSFNINSTLHEEYYEISNGIYKKIYFSGNYTEIKKIRADEHLITDLIEFPQNKLRLNLLYMDTEIKNAFFIIYKNRLTCDPFFDNI